MGHDCTRRCSGQPGARHVRFRVLHGLDVRAEDGVGNRNARIQTWQCFGSANQEWGIVFAGQYGGKDYFEFAGKTTGSLCMEVRGSSFADGAQVDQFLCAPDANQLWRLERGKRQQPLHAGQHEQRQVS